MLNILLILLSVSAVAVADIFLRETESLPFSKALTSPWMAGAVLLYLFQIFFFTYLFDRGARLGYVGILQTVLYAVIVVGGGVLIFGESFTHLQIVGIILALSGVILLNL